MQDEIDAVLMATDSIIGQAGRAGVVLILNGSRGKKALGWEWDKLPDYGRLQHLSSNQIARKVDWCIHHGWLRIEYDRHIPLLFHTSKGWERVKVLWVARILGWFEEWSEAQRRKRSGPAWKPSTARLNSCCWTISHRSSASSLCRSYTPGFPMRYAPYGPLSTARCRHWASEACHIPSDIREWGANPYNDRYNP